MTETQQRKPSGQTSFRGGIYNGSRACGLQRARPARRPRSASFERLHLATGTARLRLLRFERIRGLSEFAVTVQGMGSRRTNPKKNKAARRRRPAGTPGARRAQLEMDDIFQLMSVAPPLALPLVALASVWLWNMAEDREAAAHCVDGCLTLHYALAEYGIASRVEAVGIRLEGLGSHHATYGQNPRYNADGTFNGHTVLVATGAGRLIDPTIGQFDEVPSSRQGMLPVQAPLPVSGGLGERPFGIARHGYVVVYEPLPQELRQAWRSPVISTRTADYRKAGANLAANVVAILLIPEMLARARQAPYPRLRTLLAALEGTKLVADHRGFRFADPAGKEIWLADVP